MAEPGYQIGPRFFPFPTSFRLGDPVLIRDLTGMDWNEFLRAMPDEDDPEAIGDPIVLLGLLGVAVWQKNPTWSRDKVVRYTQSINIEQVEAVGVSEDDEESDASPPETTAGSTQSEKPASRSKPDSDSPLEELSQMPSGSLLSVTTPE